VTSDVDVVLCKLDLQSLRLVLKGLYKDNVDGAKFQQVMYQNGDFPYTLYYLFMNAVSMKYSYIVSFPLDGRAFIVYDKAKFEKMVIPKFFSHKSYQSIMT